MLQLTTPPALEPVTLEEARAHLKLDTADDDALVTALIAAARIRAEWATRRAFLTQGWTLWRDRWPCGPIALPLPPLQAVGAVTAYDGAGNASVFAAEAYDVDLAGGRLAFRDGIAAPMSLRRTNALSVAYTCGYGDAAADVPQAIRRAIAMIAADLYAHRGDEPPTPSAALALLEPFRVLTL